MHTLYSSDDFAVVQIDFEGPEPAIAADGAALGQPLSRGGFEIVDKRLRKEIFLGGAMADAFREQVQALASREPSTEAIDEFLDGYSHWMHQPLVAH
jgi:hypothetical protein